MAVRPEPEARNPASQLTSREGKAKSLASPDARLGDRGRWGCHKSPEMSVLVHPHIYGLHGRVSVQPRLRLEKVAGCPSGLLDDSRFIQAFLSHLALPLPWGCVDNPGRPVWTTAVGSFTPAPPQPPLRTYHPPSSNSQDRTKLQMLL